MIKVALFAAANFSLARCHYSIKTGRSLAVWEPCLGGACDVRTQTTQAQTDHLSQIAAS